MELSALYETVNLLTILVGFVSLLFFFVKNLHVGDAIFLFILSSLSIFFLYWMDYRVVFNIYVVLFSIYFVFHQKNEIKFSDNGKRRLNLLGYSAIALLFIMIQAVHGQLGWQSVVSSSVKYWVLYSLVFLYAFSKSDQAKVRIAVLVLLSGVVWQFKLSFLIALSLLLLHLVTSRSTFTWIRYGAGLALISVLSIFMFSDTLMSFIENSVLRAGYQHDTKIFGLSDGARLIVWDAYLSDAVWIGKGGYRLPDLIPTHNIFVYFAHEGGILAMITFGAIFLGLIFRLAYYSSVPMAFLIFASFNLSSIAEFSTTWVVCLIFVPAFFGSRLSRRGSVPIGQNHHAAAIHHAN